MLSSRLNFAAFSLSLLLAFVPAESGAAPASVYPVRAEGFTQSLNGDWSFKYIPSLEAGADSAFTAPEFDVSHWKTIPVPANWELKGFAEPGYDLKGLKDGLGLYRRAFRVPADWHDGRRVCLRFDGVAYGFTAWVNGREVGASSASAYNPHTFDITDALEADPTAGNVLAVRVTTKPRAWEADINDDWALSGIFRDVTLFSVPLTHVQDVTTRTRLAGDGADLSVAVRANQPDADIQARLLDPEDKPAGEFPLPRQADGTFQGVLHVSTPRLWTAETPALYRLQITLLENGRNRQTIETRVGLREVSIAGGVLLLNGRPVKLHGVDHHDLDPIDGRAITETEMRRDLDLMRRGNINFIRTSHYPPQPRFIELCDELGFYVMCEVPFGRGKVHFNDPAYHDDLIARVEPTITRDKNHPSVIVWSVGNESLVNNLEQEAGRLVKRLDPTRPICFPKVPSAYIKSFEQNPDYADIGSPHYPDNSMLREVAKKSKQPLILTEYAHAWGLATDRIQDQWDFMQKTPRCAGGAIWHFMDQGILRTSAKPVDGSRQTTDAWLDEHRYYDSHDGDGCDGLVYADRTPQTDFWETRKVYSPVQIAERSATVRPGAQEIGLTVENRYDFISLAGKKLAWSLLRNGAELANGRLPLHAASHATESLNIPVNIPADATRDVLALNVRCLDENDHPITERAVQLDTPGSRRNQWPAELPPAAKPEVSDTPGETRISTPGWTLTVARPGGELAIKDRTGRVLVSGLYPHTGHKFTLTETRLVKKTDIWRAPLLTRLTAPSVQVTQDHSTIRLSVKGTYPRPDDEAQSLVGGYQVEISPSDSLVISYDYAPTNAKGVLTEAGLSVVLPASLDEFRWIGQGPYAGYPGKDRLNEFGLFHLNREDLRFPGNRRATELALLTTSGGAGVALATASPSDVAVERDGDKTLLSHNALLSSPGNKAWLPEYLVKAETTPHIAGSFTLVPLEDAWPPILVRFFGQPAAAKDVFHPFYHSYDQ